MVVRRVLGVVSLVLVSAACSSSSDVGSAAGSDGGTGGGGGGGGGNPPTLAGCTVFPADNPMNQDVSGLPVSAKSDTYIQAMSPSKHLHADWGNWSTDHYGVPWQSGTGAPPVAFDWSEKYGTTESDKMACASGGGDFCYPIPTSSKLEGGPGASSGDDRHLLYIDTAGAPNGCTLYEIYNAQNYTSGAWTASNGAVFHLGSNALRPDQWTSADAAGLSVFAGLVRYDEVAAGEIRHAIRFTVQKSQNGFIHPATHAAGDADDSLPPMGLRVRLKASFDLSGFSGPALVIATAMKKYGLILADNGSDWFLTGDSDDRWNDAIDEINQTFGKISGGDFEALDTGPIIKTAD
ncbi:MAG: hypothetical protein ABI551_12140 [Polyangiaceae bacterium]